MSLISEQVWNLRERAKLHSNNSRDYHVLNHAANTIEELSAKLASSNMERSEQHYDNDYVKVIRCKDCKRWGTGVAGETEHVKCCEFGKYMVDKNGYCVYGEKK
jgi:hypothetical protein